MRWLVPVLLCGCGSEPDAFSGPPEPDADPYCHYDCFGYSECKAGVVRTWEHAPIPCDEWTGECRSWESHVCERGCRTDVEQGPHSDPAWMCEENRPKQLGDRCTEEAHCNPEVATILADGTVVTPYLTCDLAQGVCVARDPPVIPDLFEPCDLHVTERPDGSYGYGVIETDACSGGVCRWSEEYPSETCLWQWCTAECIDDGDCPPGTVCTETSYVWRLCNPPGWDWELGDYPITCQE